MVLKIPQCLYYTSKTFCCQAEMDMEIMFFTFGPKGVTSGTHY